MTSGVSERLTSVAIRSPGLSFPCAGCSGPTFRTRPSSIPPEPVTGFCIFPRAWTISWMRATTASGAPLHDSRICLNDAASTLRLSTSISSSEGRSGSDGSSRAARCGSTPGSPTTRPSP